MRTWIALAALGALTACGGTTPTSPTPTPPAQITVTGQITETLTGAALGTFTETVARLPALVTVSAPGHVTRAAWITTATPTVDLIAEAGFHLDFYRPLVRNTFDAPGGGMEPLRRQLASPRLYIRTVDEAGHPIDGTTLAVVESAIVSVAEAFTGGRFGIAGVERGTETRVGQTGWITVKWLNPVAANMCGRAPVGGAYIELNYLDTRCACNGSAIRPRTAKHELGHAMGFWHTGDVGDLMSGASVGGCDQPLSARERHHAAIAYSRPIGSRDVDADPLGGASLAPSRLAIP